jgi:hypothetical protein
MTRAAVPEVAIPASSSAPDSSVAGGVDSTRLRQAVILVAVTALQIAFFLAMAKHRMIDGDEGFYLLASRLVFEHKLPYRDFLYLQMPLLPYVYGLWMQIAGQSWLAARSLSVLLSACLGTLIYAHVRTRTGRPLAGLFAVALYASSADVLGWFVTVKTYALSCLLLFAAYALLNLKSRPTLLAACASGALLGFAVDTRLYLVAAAPLFLLWLRMQPRELRYFLLGFAAALSPNLYFFLTDPQAYWFGNLGYHAVRGGAGLIGNVPQKIRVLSLSGLDLGLYGLFVFAAFSRRKSQATSRVLALASLLLFVSLLPTPTYLQYFCILVPFLAAGAGYALSGMSRRHSGIAWILLFICIGSPFALIEYGWFFRPQANNWRWETAERVSDALGRIARAGEPVLATWPGYVFGANVEAFPGTENEFGLACSASLTPDAQRRYRMISAAQIEEALHHRKVRIVAVSAPSAPGGDVPNSPAYARLLTQSGYRLAETIGGVSFWMLTNPAVVPGGR